CARFLRLRIHRTTIAFRGPPEGTINPWSKPRESLESQTENVCASESKRLSNAFNAIARDQQSLLRFRNAGFRDKLSRRFTKRLMEQTSEITAGKSPPLGEDVYGKRVGKSRGEPRRKVGKTGRSMGLKIQR